MITLNGSIQRKFFFPADPLTSLIYFSDLSRIVYMLPHISVVETYSRDEVRIRYQTVELGAYTINIFCDLVSSVDIENQAILVKPLQGRKVIKGEATLNATTAYGYYTSLARLYPEEDGTGIDYQLKFESELQRPRGLRMMPKRVVDRIAQSISFGRVEEIAEGFMESAREAFPAWLRDQDDDMGRHWLAARGNGQADPSRPREKR